MTETLAVLALDAADWGLCHRWHCENILLDEARELETFSHSKAYPYTPEVWATVATGVRPEGHGIGETRQEVTWDNPALHAASHVTQYLPDQWRRALGRPFRANGFDHTFETVRSICDHPFDAVRSWPGLGDCPDLNEMWLRMAEADRGEIAVEELQKTFHRLTGSEFGWLASMAHTDARLVGVHCHTLDAAGHIFADRPAELREWYEWVDGQVGWLREAVDRLVILSDHGMQTAATDDAEPGLHSWRALIATQGVSSSPPGHVDGVRSWLERERPAADTAAESGRVEMDTATETLRDLGYVQ